MNEREEAVARAIWDALYESGTSWDDWADYAAKNPGGFDGRDMSRKLARAAIAAIAMTDTEMVKLPSTAGICAFDRDECTVTIAFDTEAEVDVLLRMMPSKSRVTLCENAALASSPAPTDLENGEPPAQTKE